MPKSAEADDNMFLSGPLGVIFAKTAAPIILVMATNGLFTLVDAWFLGKFVGPDALGAVTLMFPVFMLIIAISTLVSNGFSSVLARRLGAAKMDRAGNAFANALTISALICISMILLFLAGGQAFIQSLAKGSVILADLGYIYISIMVFFSPVVFLMSINMDALRCEGRFAFLGIVSLASTLLNVPFNYMLIVTADMGVAGSAYGSVLAQIFVLVAIYFYRKRRITAFRMGSILNATVFRDWKDFLTLGAPTSLSYVGVSLTSGAIIYSLQIWGTDNYTSTVAAYGIVTRLMTFMFLPLLGLSIAFQTIVGNNYGADEHRRVKTAMKIALCVALVYCATIEALFITTAGGISTVFVDDAAIALETGRILPWTALMLFAFGPQLMISAYFQAIGDAPRAAVLGLSRTYVFGLPLLFIVPLFFGEWGIWYAGPLSEICAILLTAMVLYHLYRKREKQMAPA